jgi:hypothetical protein
MQTTLGFWCFQRRSSLIGSYMMTYVDDGFGELIASPFPIHAFRDLELL